MPRYELAEGSSSRFWEIELRGTSFTTRWGQVGEEGQSKSQRFANAETATSEYEQLILSKENEGYQLSAPPVPEEERVLVRLEDGSGQWRELELRGTKLIQRAPSKDDDPQESSTRFENFAEAKDQFEFLIGRYLKQGNKEVSRTSGRVVREPGAVKLVSHPEYEAACLAAPGDLKPWQIYADWLQEHGDVRGELAALFLGRKADAAWKRLDAQRDALLGPYSERELFDLTVTNGFFTGATLKRATRDSQTDLAALTSDFLSRPAARFVSELKFGLAGFQRENDWTTTVKALCQAPQAKQLRKLEFNAFDHQSWEIAWVPFGDLSPLWSGLPALEYLHVRAGGAGTLGRIEHPKLQTLIRESGGLPREELDVILDAKCPALERLEIWTGFGEAASATSDQFAEMLRGERFPRLNHLGLVNSEFTLQLVRALEKSPLLPRLRVLDLSKGGLADADVDLLLRVAPKFAHLRLDLSENFFAERLGELRRAFPRVNLESQRDESERYDPAGE